MTEYDLIERIVHLEDELSYFDRFKIFTIICGLVSILSIIVCVICTFVTIHYSKDGY